MDYPDIRLPHRLEMAFGQQSVAPNKWTWTDVTEELSSRVLGQTITPKRGRSDESSVTTPSALSALFDNLDGNLSPRNPNSVYWPHVILGVPLRSSVDVGTPALLLSGSGGATTPDHADFDVTNLDLRIRIQPTAWANPVNWALGSGQRSLLDTSQRIFSKWDALTGDNRSWNLALWSAGWPSIEWSTDGTAGNTTFLWADELVAALRPIWIAMIVDADAGDTNHVATIYRSDAAIPPADVTTWDIIQTWDIAGTTSINGGSAAIRLGGLYGGDSFNGRILSFEARDDINGSLIADPDFTAATIGDPTVTDSTGKVWTLTGDAEISNRRYRYVGRIDDWDGPEWPYGDNEAGNEARPSESRVAVTASGILRRLGTGSRSKPLGSTLRRHIRSARFAADIIAYWPCEDDQAAVQLAGGTPETSPAQVAETTLGAEDGLLASANLPTVGSDDIGTWLGQVPTDGATDTHWAVDWFWRMPTPETNPTFSRIITVTSAGDLTEWRILINDTNFIVEAYDAFGTQVFSTAFGGTGIGLYFDGWNLGRLEVTQDGADIDWSFTNTFIDLGISSIVSGTVASSTLGRVASVGNTITGPDDGYSFGHVVVSNGNLAYSWMAGADTAWVGETAAHRFWRLCDEEGIPCEVVGDPSVYSSVRGDLALSEAMGPQTRQTLVALLRQCALLDMGIIVERRGIPGLIYRCRHTLEAQDVALALDAARNARGDIAVPLEPHLDDQQILNDVTVTANQGSSAQYRDQDHIDRVGLYDTELKLAGIGGVNVQTQILAFTPGLAHAVAHQNRDQAAWRVHLGTFEGLRWPAVTIDLAIAARYYPEIIDTWLDLELGDRITLINLPTQYPDEILEFIVDHVAEAMSPTIWKPQVTCSPGGPWQVGTLT